MTVKTAPLMDSRLSQLSAKERECLRLVARRLSSKEIAAELGIAKTSVDTYCDRARAKLDVGDRYEAARLLVAELGPVDVDTTPPRSPCAEAVAPVVALPRPRRLGWVVAFALVCILALATLLAGLRALDNLEPTRLKPLEQKYQRTGVVPHLAETKGSLAGPRNPS